MTPGQYALFRWYCVFGLHRWESIDKYKQTTAMGSLVIHHLQRCQCCGNIRTVRAVVKHA